MANKYELTFSIEAVDGDTPDNIIISLVVDGQAVAWDKRVFNTSEKVSARRGTLSWLTLDGRVLTIPSVYLRKSAAYIPLDRDKAVAWFTAMRYRPAPVQAVA
jgi:hypothetical protein